MMNEYSTWLAMSIFAEKCYWHIIIKDSISPFIEALNKEDKLFAIRIRFDYLKGENIQLALLVPTSFRTQIAKDADAFFTGFLNTQLSPDLNPSVFKDRIFMPYPKNTIQYGLYLIDHLPKSTFHSSIQQGLSMAMLKGLNADSIDDSLILTFSIYISLVCYKLIPQWDVQFAKRYLSMCTAQSEYINRVKFDSVIIRAQCTELEKPVAEIYKEVMGIACDTELSWLSDWEATLTTITSNVDDQEELWSVVKQVNFAVYEQLGLNEFLGKLINTLIYECIWKHKISSSNKLYQKRNIITMSVFGNYGRLGDQLFQYASLIGITRKCNAKLKLPEWKYSPFFKCNFPKAEFEIGKQLRENELGILDDWKNLELEHPVDIIGCLQSEKYWKNYKEEIINTLEFSNEIKESLKLKYSLSGVNIAVDIRRGDYVNHPNFAQSPITWYIEALKEFSEWQDCNIMLFSDDIPYCREHFSQLTNVCFCENNSDIEDLYLMSQCNKFILSNSSFSWWGAYLSKASGENIIRPDHHFVGQYAIDNDDRDFWPSSWRIFNI